MKEVIQFLKTNSDYTIQKTFGKENIDRLVRELGKPENTSWREFLNQERPSPRPKPHHRASKLSYYRIKELEKWSGLWSIAMWADWDKIEEIYINCPEGYQVDHIIPLQSRYVCGLHTEDNLQYLTIEDNRRKSNKIL